MYIFYYLLHIVHRNFKIDVDLSVSHVPRVNTGPVYFHFHSVYEHAVMLFI